MSKHTPGPWRIKEAKQRHHYQPHDTDICAPEGRGLICTLYTENWDHKGVIDKANARLIAAAPDLLAAAEIGLRWTQMRGDAIHDADLIHAAIAKAKGET